jgi:aminoglycoside phosphotransferase (APT) family kinase protein
LGRLHVWGESRVKELSRGSIVRWDDPDMHMRWARRARRELGDRGPAAGTAHLLDPLWRRYGIVARRLNAMPKTLVHGDFNASNILVTRSPAGNRVRVIDWETAGVGPGLLDLASLVSGRLPEGLKEQMVAAYRANLEGGRLAALSDTEFDEALCWCRLALAVKWLGWSPGWSAPDAHAYDWWREALATAHRLGLLESS